jgi:carbon monoxide dehydrogenase subunit G/DNA-directed RNA polymerase subunit RPC12/RpoP
MAVELDHSFTTSKPDDESFAAITDLERVVPAVQGGSVLETTGPDSVKAEILVKMGAMSMTFTGTVEVTEKDADDHRAVLTVKSREAGGQGHANATVTFALAKRTPRSPARRPPWARASSRACSTRSSRTSRRGWATSEAMARVVMRAVRPGEVPYDGGTAVQEDADRPAFRGNGPDDYVCVECGNVLAESMHEMQMTYKVRVRCGRCSTINVSATDVHEPGLRKH